MIFSRLGKREKYILYAAIIIVAGVLFDRAVISPITKKIDKSNDEIRGREKKLENFLRTLTREEAIIGEYKEYTKDIKQTVSDEEEIAKFLSLIEKLAGKSAISLLDIKPGKVEEQGRFKKYLVKIELESKISLLADFIYQLESLPQFIRVEDFSIAPKKAKSTVLKADITISELLITEISAEEAKVEAKAEEKKL